MGYGCPPSISDLSRPGFRLMSATWRVLPRIKLMMCTAVVRATRAFTLETDSRNRATSSPSGRQFARRAGVGDPLGVSSRGQTSRRRRSASRKRPGSAIPRSALRRHLDSIGVYALKAKPFVRAAEILVELRDGMDIGSLRRRRQIADRHVLDHPQPQGAHLGHLKSPV